jgi:general secretion pathway protein A
MEDNPFTTTALPEGLFVTESLAAVIAKVEYVIENRQGLTVVYGDIGHGKTSLLRYLHAQYDAREDCVAGYLPTPAYKTDVAFLRAICGEFGLSVRRSMLDQEQGLRAFLVEHYAEGRNVVIFVDEAQIIQGRVLELVRLLTNLETDRHKLIQIVLCGQLELRDRLRDPTKKALRSRIFITSTLDPLTLDETRGVIARRCEVMAAPNPFPPETVEAIWTEARGVPRDVMKLCGLTYATATRSGFDEVPIEAVAAVAGDLER